MIANAVIHGGLSGLTGIDHKHHAHVFMLKNVAMADKGTLEGAELDHDLRLLTTLQIHHIAIMFVLNGETRIVSIDIINSQHLETLQVYVDRMPPTSATIANDPAFATVQEWGCIRSSRTEEQVINLPSPIATAKIKDPRLNYFRFFIGNIRP